MLFLPKKNFFFILGVVHNDPFSMQIGSKKTIFQRFYQFFQNCWLSAHVINIVSSNIFHRKSVKVKESKVGVVFGGQNFCQIRSNVMKKAKELVFTWVFFHALHEIYIYKQKGKVYRKT